MNYILDRVAVTSLSLFIAFGSSSCASEVDGTDSLTDDERLAQLAAEVSDGPAIDSSAQPQLPDGLAQVDIEDMLGTEKVRRGTVIDYDHIVGNSTVMVSRWSGFPSTIQAFCTAQVLNRYFLLTAAHCIPLLFPSGSGTLQVHFTKRDGTKTRIYNSTATGLSEPGFIRGGKDTGLIYLRNRITSCHGTLAQCANQPDVPVNAVFQWVSPGSNIFTRTSYAIVGYGNATDPPATDFGTLRLGTMTRDAASSGFTDSNTGYATVLSWTADTQARPCAGDSGSALVVTGFARLLHLGAASLMTNSGSCNTMTGSVAYAGMTTTELNWVNGELNARKSSSVVFDCSASADLVTGLFTFHCDNDGTIN